MTSEPIGFIYALLQDIRGDVYHDPVTLGIYATDASIYQITPVAVVCPKDEEDVRTCLKIANQYQVPILARGGGTSLAGQTVAEAIVIDFSKYMNKILSFENDLVSVQPGVIRSQLNKFLKPHGLEFAPDPATGTRATIGGMVANNSSGTKSIIYGKTGDHVVELKVMMVDGKVIHTKALSSVELQDKLSGEDEDRFYYKKMMDIVLPLQTEVSERYPKTMRRVGGYAFDDFISSGFGDLNRIIIGSEGTLGIILEAKLNVVRLPKFKGLSVVQFDHAQDAIKATITMVKYKPSAVEILSRLLIGYSRKNIETAPMCGFLKGDPDSIQIIEFYGDDPQEIKNRAESMHTELRSLGFGYAHDYYPEGKTYYDVWGIRERGLGLLLGEPTDKKGVPVIEDAAIPLEHLDAFIAKVVVICESKGVGVDYYAHASVGVIHIKPILDLRVQGDIDLFKKIADEVFQLVLFYKGSWSSEHGDGLVRSSYLREFYGDTIYEGFRKTKILFDPDHLLNPEKIVDAPPIDSHLRYGALYHDWPFESVYKYREQHDFHTAVHQCSGLGACRKISGGTMCPSFMVTLDERDSTRGRANALRLAMSGQLEDGLANKELPEILDLCLSCKACKAECPSSVDMARLKGEVMQYQFDHLGVSLKDKMIGKSADLARKFAGKKAGVVNLFQNMAGIRHLVMKSIGMDARRRLPTYASKLWTKSHSEQHAKTLGGDPDVILLTDTYTQCHQPESGIAAVRLLEALGQNVMLLDAGCCQRPRISHGFLKEAAQKVKPAIEKIIPWLDKNIPIAVLEPGCASAWADDIPDLIEDDVTADALKKIMTFEQLLLTVLKKATNGSDVIKPKSAHVLVHGHCHQKSIYGMDAVKEIFSMWPATKYEEIDSGCCGMAGSFGYEAKHYDISKKMAERVLVPSINAKPDAMVIANGFSCRHQIADFADRKAVHIAEAFEINK
ncbi:MAG: FAD-binding oxidoreductase [Saprospiraceae bacterium]|uniref:FAD-binding oxidoreductase n=1 Tax=Candidatus Opimibacter skivensis TaxID=2982028 RepID=A0A9D7SX58_9BACT|nr:FAD-binding oxidoreductase [Candidatus Opimibacter skivensis]